ncbi:MAG: hypothetical protein GX824_04750 [Clostridiales bacterium]|nr:hypothetical protein [Clostridiales bacterium]
MNNKKYFLGVDGGGTKTTAVVSDSSGRVLCACEGESINYYAIGLEKARSNMKKVFASVSEKCGIVFFDGAFIGMSALNSRADEKELRAFTGGVVNAAKTDMASDLYVALEALLEKGECAVAISGTGSMSIARDKKGKTSCIGGWGHILGDEGSGYSIALEAIRAAIRAYEGSAPKTELTNAVLEHYKINKPQELIDLFYNKPIEKKEIAAFAIPARLCAQNGDEIAAQIILKNADDFSKTVLALLCRYSNGIRIGLWGGIFQHCPQYLNRFSKNLADKGYTNVGLLQYPPEIGAIFAAMKLCGLEISECIQTNLKQYAEGRRNE